MTVLHVNIAKEGDKMVLDKKKCHKLYKEFFHSIIEQLSYNTPYIRCMNCFSSEDSGGMCEGDPSNVYCGSWGHDINRPVCEDFDSYKLCTIDLNADITTHELSKAINNYIFTKKRKK